METTSASEGADANADATSPLSLEGPKRRVSLIVLNLLYTAFTQRDNSEKQVPPMTNIFCTAKRASAPSH